jgi:glycosyltransferase involved in cell wall biosynthesis
VVTQDQDRHVAVLTPWYPDAQIPFAGAFVESMAAAVAPGLDRLDVFHTDEWIVNASAERRERIWDVQASLLPRSVPSVKAVAGARLRRVPVILPKSKWRDFAERADHHAHWLKTALGGKPIEAPVIHAHVPIYSAWAALQNCRPDARVYATEHASFLVKILRQPRARAMYDEILHRLAGFFVVGDVLHDVVAGTFPHHAGKIQYIANPIDFGSRRAAPPTALRRWLSVASFKTGKRHDHLLRAFAACRAEDPSLTLTLAGDGVLRPEIEALVDELGVREAVTFLGIVQPSEVPGIMAAHDVLVHPSAFETFGVVAVEALAAGIPVLITRCGGPELVLDGIEDAAGVMIDVVDDPQALVDGYRLLRERYPSKTDLEHARGHLESKYGYEAIGAQHHRIWFGENGAER